MATVQITSLLVLPLTVIISFNLSSSTANPLIHYWKADSVENIIPHSAGTEIKNNEDFSTLKEHRRIKKEMATASYSKGLQQGDGASVIGDSRKPRSEFGLNEDSEMAVDVMKNSSNTEGAGESNAKAMSEKSIVSEPEVSPDQPDGDSAFNTESSVLESRSVQNSQRLTEINEPNSSLSTNDGTSVGNTAELSKDIPSVLDHKKSEDIREDPSKLMTDDSKVKKFKNNAMSKSGNSGIDTEGTDIPETDDESQRTLNIREVGGISASPNLIFENNMSDLQGVKHEDPLAQVYGSRPHNIEGSSSVGNTDFQRGLLSDFNNREAIENKVTKRVTGMEWSDSLNKDENSTTFPSHDIDAFFKLFRPFVNSKISESLQNSQEDNVPLSLENFNNGVEPRYIPQDQSFSYYSPTAADAEYLKNTLSPNNQMCLVPCLRTNYVVQPQAYGLYVAGSDPNYSTGAQVSQVALPPAYLPPLQFPQIHSGAAAYSSAAVDGHEGHAEANQNAHAQNYAVTSNAYGGSFQGSPSYGGASHSYVKEPLNHLEYSLTTPEKVFHTSLILKPPRLPSVLTLHPQQYVLPGIHHAAQPNINLKKSTYF